MVSACCMCGYIPKAQHWPGCGAFSPWAFFHPVLHGTFQSSEPHKASELGFMPWASCPLLGSCPPGYRKWRFHPSQFRTIDTVGSHHRHPLGASHKSGGVSDDSQTVTPNFQCPPLLISEQAKYDGEKPPFGGSLMSQLPLGLHCQLRICSLSVPC